MSTTIFVYAGCVSIHDDSAFLKEKPWSKDISNYWDPNISYSVLLFSLVRCETAEPWGLVLSGFSPCRSMIPHLSDIDKLYEYDRITINQSFVL